jgi:DASS family divalent anion:Na+ symporter
VAGILAAPLPEGINARSWRLLAIFIGTIVGSIVRPVPAGAMVFLGVAAVALTGTLTPAQALGGYADPIVWLVLCAFMISRAIVKTGLGRRIALLFIRTIGHRSIGLAYALVGTDTLLASLVPSNGARAGGVVFPIARSLAEAYDSTPGPTRRRLGAFLMVTVYHATLIACAMFLTGRASNVLVAKFAKDVGGVDLSYGRWLLSGLVYGLVR